jgi:hypothetical protein
MNLKECHLIFPFEREEEKNNLQQSLSHQFKNSAIDYGFFDRVFFGTKYCIKQAKTGFVFVLFFFLENIYSERYLIFLRRKNPHLFALFKVRVY